MASVIWPGLGQVYNGQVGRGIILIVVAVISAVAVLNGYHPPRMGTLFYLGLFLFGILWIYGIYDAFNTAKSINEGAY